LGMLACDHTAWGFAIHLVSHVGFVGCPPGTRFTLPAITKLRSGPNVPPCPFSLWQASHFCVRIVWPSVINCVGERDLLLLLAAVLDDALDGGAEGVGDGALADVSGVVGAVAMML